MNDIRIRDHEQGIRVKEDSIKSFDAADDLLNVAHHAYIKGRESVEKQDEEKPEDQLVEKMREGKDAAVDAAERYIKKYLEEEDEPLEMEGAGYVPSDPAEVEYVPPEGRNERIITQYRERMETSAARQHNGPDPSPDQDIIFQNTENKTVAEILPEERGTYPGSTAPSDHFVQETELSSDQSTVPMGTNPTSYGDSSVPDAYHAIKTRETSSIKEYRPSIKYADKSIKTSDAAGKTIKAEEAVEAEEAARKSSQTAGAVGRAAAKQSANTAGQAAASESAAASSAANSAAASAAEASAESAAASNWIVWVVIAFIIIIMIIMANFMSSILTYRMTGNDESIAIRDAITEINQEFQAELDRLRNRREYDNVILEGSRPKWRDVLAVYFAKTSDDSVEGIDTYSFYYISERGKEKLKDIFWDMTDIDTAEDRYSVQEYVRTEDEDGNAAYELQTVRKIDLTITVSSKSAYEMSESILYMNDEQCEILYDLMSAEYDDLWPMVIYGYFPEDCPIVEVALQEVGNIGGEKYWRWYGFGSHVDWCACFVSWCASECGYIGDGIFPKYAKCTIGVEWFQEHGQWLSADNEPAPGMIIFFDWDHPEGQSGPQDGRADHTGIVEKVEDGIIYTVEGNAWDVCMQNQYPVGGYEILGYGTYTSE